MTNRDRWAEWLAERRFGGDPAWRTKTLEKLVPVRDRILDNASLSEGDVVLDVGAGDGLIGFAALERVGKRGRVVLSDLSDDLLVTCREIAAALDVVDRCSFVRAPADDLGAIEDGDVVTTRSVLIYVADKLSALKEFRRVLKAGGRISLFEPINSFCYPEPRDSFWGYDVRAVRPLVDKLRVYYEQHGAEGEIGPMVDFDERDLLGWVEEAGFGEIHLDYKVEISPMPMLAGMSWDAFLSFSGNPLEPTLEEAAAGAFTAEERDRLYEHLRPLVERSEGQGRFAHAYLWAVK